MELEKRKHPRLKEYDYSQAGYYFVTVCTKDRAEILSQIVGRGMTDPPSFVGRDDPGAPQFTGHNDPAFRCVGRGFPDEPQFAGYNNPAFRCVGRGFLDAPQVQLTAYGKLVEGSLIYLNAHSKNVRVDKYVIMPNHIHLILQIKEESASESRCADGASGKPRPTDALIPKFMSSLKRYTNRKAGCAFWQTSYYDHIIRNEADYLRIWDYIDANPAKWKEDEYYAP